MESNIPALVMGFREGLEAFLIVGVMLRMLSEGSLQSLKRHVWSGVWAGVVASVLFGWGLYAVGSLLSQVEGLTKVWESLASLVAMLLVSTFIIWMIRHGENMVNEVQRSTRQNLSAWGLFALALVMVSREGAEIAVFAFAGKYSLLATGLGVGGALVLTTLAIRSIIRVPLASILRYTLIYLVLQSGYLIGYGVHEGLSALKSFGVLSGDLFIYQKAFDLSQGVLSHKDGLVGLPLNILFGWYSKPEWVQFIVQYGYTLAIFGYWISFSKGSRR